MAKKVDVDLTAKGFHDPRPPINVVFVGHVDAGKSTTCGNILVLSGLIDPRQIERYERESRENNREGWYLAYVFDLTEEERSKGKTVEVGRASFDLPNSRFTILDAPGHKAFVPNMIAGAAQADVGVLIISARKGEFEAGFDKGGQTREHALLCKTLGVQRLVVAVNKMDEQTCLWSKDRYEGIKVKVSKYLNSIGFPDKTVVYVPISGLSGQNIKDHVSDPKFAKFEAKASWYERKQPTLLEILDTTHKYLMPRDYDAPFRMPVVETYKDQGIMCIGKIEMGTVSPGQQLQGIPGTRVFKVDQVMIQSVGPEEEGTEVPMAGVGENICLRLADIEATELPQGSVLCDPKFPIRTTRMIMSTIMIVDTLESRPIITAGYNCVVHAHTLQAQCSVFKLVSVKDKATKRMVKYPSFVKVGQIVTCIISFDEALAIEAFSASPGLGRFTLRDESKTIAIGKVMLKCLDGN